MLYNTLPNNPSSRAKLTTGQEIMPSRKLEEKNIRKLTRTGRAGSSFGLTLPKELVIELGWREKQRLVVKKIRGGLIIRDYRSK